MVALRLAVAAAASACFTSATFMATPEEQALNGGRLWGPANDPEQLAAGSNKLDYTPAFTNNYYRFLAPGNANGALFSTLTMSVSPISGNPNLNAGFTPTTATYSASSTTGIDYIQISANDTALLAYCYTDSLWKVGNLCPIFMWVVPGPRATNYTIAVTDGSAGTSLVPEVPYIGRIQYNDTVPVQGFTLNLPAAPASGQITFSLSPLSGFGRNSVPILAVSNNTASPDWTNPNQTCAYANTAALSGRESIVLTPASSCWCTSFPCTLYVAVAARNTPAIQQFSLTASLLLSPYTLLQDGVQAAGNGVANVPALATQYYEFNAGFDPNNARAVRIIQIPLQGSAFVFATVDGTVPAANNNQYSATRLSGQNEVVVRITDPAVVQYCGIAVGNNGTCTIKIAVSIVTNQAAYTIEARSAALYRLSPGVPVQDYVFPNRVSNYYMPDVNYGGVFEASLTPISNQFISLFVGSDMKARAIDVNNSATYCYTAQARGAPVALTIAPSDPCYCNTTSCNYYLAVTTGYNASATYTVLGKYTGGYQLLQLNVPFTDALPYPSPSLPTNTYIMPYPDALNRSAGGPAASLTFNVDAVLGAGNLQLRAAICVTNATCNLTAGFTSQYPPATVYATSGNGQIVISATDPQFISNCVNVLAQQNALGNFNATCLAWFSVTADSTVTQTAVYTVTPYAYARQLVDGQVVTARSLGGQLTYFRYTVVDTTRPLRINVAPLQGNPELYVGLGFWPSPTNYSFTSLTAGAEVLTITWDSATITNMSLRVPFDVNIAVEGFDGPALYTIDATSNGIVGLQLNTPVAGAAGPLGFAYFFFNLPANFSRLQGFRLDVVSITGPQPVILVNTPVFPGPFGWPSLPRCQYAVCDGLNFANAPITSFQSFTPNYVEVDPTNSDGSPNSVYAPGTYAIGIYGGPSPSTFQLTVSTINGVQVLSDGLPTPGFLNGANYSFYQLQVFTQFDGVEIVVTSTSSFQAGIDIFATANYTTRRPTAALAATSSWIQTNVANAPRQRSIMIVNATAFTGVGNAAGTPCNVAPCQLYFGLAETNARYQAANISYIVTARILRPFSYTFLPVGVPQYDLLPSFSANYYIANVDSGNNNTRYGASISLSPVRNNVNMYVTLDGSNPGPSNSLFNATAASGVDYIYVPRYVINQFANSTGSRIVQLRIAVTTGQLDNGVTASYFIDWSDNDPNSLVQLLPNTPQSNTLRNGAYQYYYFTQGTADPVLDLTFSLASSGQAGQLSLYVQQWSNVGNNSAYRPGPGSNCANSTSQDSFANDWVIIPGINSTTPQDANNGYAPQCRCTSYPCNYLVAVGCNSLTAGCTYGITATIGDQTPLRMVEGAQYRQPVQPGKVTYYYIDMSVVMARNASITLSATGGSTPLYLWATNTFVPGVTDPSLLPTPVSANTYIFTAPASGSTPTPSLTLTSNSFTACNVTFCPLLTIGVTTFTASINSPGIVVSPTLTWFSDGGVAQQLALGVASAPQGVSFASTRRFRLDSIDPTKDLTVFATLYEGTVAFTISTDGAGLVSDPTCTIVVAQPITCNGVWSYTATSGTPILTISAANPCGSATGPCPTNGTVFSRNKPLYINVVATSNTGATFTLTASSAGVPALLSDGQALSSVTNALDKPLFVFQTTAPSQTARPNPVTFFVTTGNVPVTIYINQCKPSDCTTTTRLPGPGNSQASFTLNPGTTQVLALAGGSAGYCPPQFGVTCLYYVAVYPPQTSCPASTCTAPFTISATEYASTPVPLLFDEYVNKVSQFGDRSTPLPANGQLFQVGLDPASGGSDIVVALDSCGPGYPAMYACNPNEGGCNPATLPGPTNQNHNAYPINNTGRDYLVMRNVAGVNSLFLNAKADTQSNYATPNYQMLLSVRTGFFLLSSPTDSYVPINKTGNTVTWSPAVIVGTDGTSRPAVGVSYDLYVAFGGFNASQVAPVVNSPCGLRNWLDTVSDGRSGRIQNITGVNTYVIPGVRPNDYYEVNIVARCSDACWAASLNASALAMYRSNMRALALVDGELKQTGPPFTSVPQQAPYGPVDFPSGKGGSGNNNAGPGDAIVIGAGVGGGLGLCCCVGLIVFCMRRRRGMAVPKNDIKADDRAKRVAQLGLGASAPNLAQPTAAAASAAADLSAARAERATFDPVAPGGNVAGWK